MAYMPFFPAIICHAALVVPITPWAYPATASTALWPRQALYEYVQDSFCWRGTWTPRWPVVCLEEGVGHDESCIIERADGEVISCLPCDAGRIIRPRTKLLN